MIHVFHVTTFAILTYELGLEVTSDKMGYLHAHRDLNSAVRVGVDSALLYATNLVKICSILGFPNSVPLYKLDVRKYAGLENLYFVDQCSSCYDLYIECNTFPFRLDLQGDLRVNFKSEWSAMCTTPTFSRSTAAVYCEALGLPTKNITILRGSKGRYKNSYELETKCQGTFCSLHIKESFCYQGYAAMKCNKLYKYVEYPLRIPRYGALNDKIEMQVNGIWGKVCKDGFSYSEKQVICRQLEQSTEELIELRAKMYWLVKADCTGTESTLEKCLNFDVSVGFCSNYAETLAVRCNMYTDSISTPGEPGKTRFSHRSVGLLVAGVAALFTILPVILLYKKYKGRVILYPDSRPGDQPEAGGNLIVPSQTSAPDYNPSSSIYHSVLSDFPNDHPEAGGNLIVPRQTSAAVGCESLPLLDRHPPPARSQQPVTDANIHNMLTYLRQDSSPANYDLASSIYHSVMPDPPNDHPEVRDNLILPPQLSAPVDIEELPLLDQHPSQTGPQQSAIEAYIRNRNIDLLDRLMQLRDPSRGDNSSADYDPASSIYHSVPSDPPNHQLEAGDNLIVPPQPTVPVDMYGLPMFTEWPPSQARSQQPVRDERRDPSLPDYDTATSIWHPGPSVMAAPPGYYDLFPDKEEITGVDESTV